MYRLVHNETSVGGSVSFETTIEIDAPIEEVWRTLVDVGRWPEWTASITQVEQLQGDGVAPGVRVRIKQPRMPARVWEITDVEPGESFTWQSARGGVTTVASHVLSTTGADRVAVTLGVRHFGPLAPVAGLLTSRTTRRYVQMEADGLKRRCESG
jgi:uncharacterized protein YndB with AHSA1/START domain